MRRLTGIAIAIALALPLTLTLASSPAEGLVSFLRGTGACQPDGSYSVTWTFHNYLGVPVQIHDAHIDGTATPVIFSPNSVDPDVSATATTDVAGTVEGELTAVVPFKVFEGEESEADATVDLPGDCPQPIGTTTVTTAATAPTTAVQAAAVAQPHFTG